jgi:xylulokinase
MAILSVDIGTTGTKAVLFAESGAIITMAYQEYPLVYPKPGWAEVDAEILWAAFRKTVREVAKTHKKEIQALCLSCMGQNIVPVRHDGTAVRNGILAFDNRTSAEEATLREDIGELAYFKIRGNQPNNLFGESKILWLKRNEPDTFRQTWKFMTFGDFIRTRLGFPAIIDYCMASTSLPYDISKGEYSEVIMKEIGVNRGMFSEPVPSDALLGEIGPEAQRELDLPQGVKVVTGGHDAICGVLGAGITDATPQIVADATGTWESMAYIRKKPVLTRQAMETRTGSSCSVLTGTYIVIAALRTCGTIVRWFRDELAVADRMQAGKDKADVYDVMFAPLTFEGGTAFSIPYFAGSAIDPLAKGAFLGLTLGSTRQQMLQSAVEGITHEMKVLVDRLEELSDTPVEVLRAFGGPTKSPKWLQLKADISGKKVEVVQVEEASALGAAILAGVATGIYTSYDEALGAIVKIKAVYLPRPEIHRVYQRQHEIYKQLVAALTPVNQSLYNM